MSRTEPGKARMATIKSRIDEQIGWDFKAKV